MTMTQRRFVVKASEFEASCDCDDFMRHSDREQTQAEFEQRAERSKQVNVGSIAARYGTVVVQTLTVDRRGSRLHEVILSRGDGFPWVCKHIIRAVQTIALMPDRGSKAVMFDHQEAKTFAQKVGGLVATVNGASVVGWVSN